MGALIGLLEKRDEILVKEILKILCNISNTEDGKKILVQTNALPHFNKILQNTSETSIMKFVIACYANIATCTELKRKLGESGCLIHVLHAFQQGIENKDSDLVKYSLYFIGNVCEDFPEAGYVYGRLLIMQHLYRFFNSQLSENLLSDLLDVLYVLFRIKENMYFFHVGLFFP